MHNIKIISLVLILSLTGTFMLDGCSEKKDKGQNISQNKEHKDHYYCPMHTNVTSDKPGVCPICHMDLVKSADDAAVNRDTMQGLLSLTKRGEQLANVATTTVKLENIAREINAFGYLDFTEPGRKIITARFNGRIEKLNVDASGTNIQKGQALFEIYSPDLIQAQNEYLIALRNSKQMVYASRVNDMEKTDNALLVSSKKKLGLFGITDNQISDLENSGDVKLSMTYYSPYSGTVIDKKVQEGMYVNEGTVIYDIADLSVLWNISEIYADDISAVKVGDEVKMRTSAFPGEEFPGRVTFIYPVVNPETRTVKIRSEVRNSQGKLKPQMYTETVFSKTYTKSLVIPENAVIFSGKRNVAWVRTKDGMFEPRDVIVGIKSSGKYQILSGLKEGEEVASSGSYLIDSESQLKGGKL